MAITMNDLTVNFTHLDRVALMESWRWLIGETKQPILLTALGNAFVQDLVDGAICMVDTSTGDLLAAADSMEHLTELMEDKDFVTRAFDVEAFAALQKAGMTLQPGQIFSFKVPMALGGQYVLDNIEAMDITVHFGVTGQIFEQVSKMPEGAMVSDVSLSS
ncbi:MAG: T6SS immunity protein Tdi1 domain-containing protein [Capsulimonas sp.]|uniref:T6SS immunity protein Tdi1 domain-containing protein n=1 Tax=Capsulimonas sp. TaxID=2494211 RepID=UPI0032661A6E